MTMRRGPLLGACLWLSMASSGAAYAQFRPPPASEAERLTFAGDDALAEASRLVAKKDKAGSQEVLKKAITQYEKALAADPNAMSAAIGLASAANALGDFTRASTVLTPFSLSHPESAEVAFPLGVALFKQNRYPDAAVQFEKISGLKKPEHLLAHYYLARYYLAQQRGPAALAELKLYSELRPPEVAGNDYEIFALMGQG